MLRTLEPDQEPSPEPMVKNGGRCSHQIRFETRYKSMVESEFRDPWKNREAVPRKMEQHSIPKEQMRKLVWKRR